MTARIICRTLAQIRLEIPRWRTKWRPRNTKIGCISAITELCVKIPDISCSSLTQIWLQIPRWRTKWRPCKAMDGSQAFIFHFKCYSILHFAVCPLLRWSFLLLIFSEWKDRDPLPEPPCLPHYLWCISLQV